jgi:AcrR family transcriptional regulator
VDVASRGGRGRRMARARRPGGRDPEATRRRIVEATVALHEEIGPAATTITAIAARAGVQRLTVYRHFPKERAVLAACSAHWMAEHPLPDAAAWAGLANPAARLRRALAAVYAWYGAGEPMLRQLLRDAPVVPALAELVAPFGGWLRELGGQLSAGWGAAGESQRRLRAAVGHALRFETWCSLKEEGLTDEEAASLMAGFVEGVKPLDSAG